MRALHRVRAVVISAVLGCALVSARAAEHPAQGLVLKVDAAHRKLVVSCAAIPGYMAAMDMPLEVRDMHMLGALRPGMMIRFTLVEQGKRTAAEHIQPVMNFEAEPAEAEALTGLRRATAQHGAQVEVGHAVPNFTLTDQAGQRVGLSSLRGKVVVLTFGYSRCPNPNYCFRLSNNLRQVARRFHRDLGTRLVLITIAIDPEVDHGAGLSAYAQRFQADPRSWHFLTGPLPEIHRVAGMFGMDFWESEGLLTHTLHTVIIGADGRLAANLEGNAFSARQLGDLVAETMREPAGVQAHGGAPLQ
ncbi:MAG: SCO family protein [Acidobacteriota bacterium]